MQLLTLNTGSSSVKAALYQGERGEERTIAIRAERIGHTDAHFRITAVDGTPLLDEQRDFPDYGAALDALFSWLEEAQPDLMLDAVGHRLVHGGSRYRDPQRITAEMVAALRELVPIDPEHLPQALAAIEAVTKKYPHLLQIACFDTAFHQRMPPVAQLYPLPREYRDAGLIRYGFHGLSYEYIMATLRDTDPVAANGRIIIAHLGSGASMVAVRDGVSLDTTMGFTPTGGLMMGTRTGDLDPGVLLYLLTNRGLDPAALGTLVNKHSGLLGVSGTSGDMRDLLDRAATDLQARIAIDLFCYTARKNVGALSAVLGGVDTLIFTGGIGERAVPVREAICADLAYLGITLDAELNATNAPIISHMTGAVTVRVLPTDEDLVIARHTARIVSRKE
jgi:acetate kinase